MHSFTHLITSFVFGLAYSEVVSVHMSIIEILLISSAFGVLIDLNQYVGRFLKRPAKHRRTFCEEWFGIVLVSVPVGGPFYLMNPHWFVIAVGSYALHIVCDYMTQHHLSPFDPLVHNYFDSRNCSLIFTNNRFRQPKLDRKGLNQDIWTWSMIALCLLLLVYRAVQHFS
ncbi:hypothetical protein P9112_002821 [Eukaryota sp. TZLM1-RC]